MKKFTTIASILFAFIHAKAQDNKWQYLFASDTSKMPKEKTYVDTYRTAKLDYFEARKAIIVIWIRVYSKPTLQGEYLNTLDEKIAIDATANQYELLSTLERYNKNVLEQKEIDSPKWVDIYPETFGEYFLNYANSFLKK